MNSRHTNMGCPRLDISAEITILPTGLCLRPASRVCVAVALLLALVLSACDAGKEPQPVRMDFDAVFQPLDTVYLDHSIPLARVSYVDESDAGEILVLEDRGMMSTGLHVFTGSGRFVRTLDVIDCDPGADFQPRAARFVGQSRIAAPSFRGPTYLFDGDGRCVAAGRTTSHMLIAALCAVNDTLFAQQQITSSAATITAYSPLLIALDTFNLQPPKFLWFHGTFPGQAQRRLGCFDDGPWYAYAESMDAVPLRRNKRAVRFRPRFFAEPTRDVVGPNEIEDAFNVLGEATLTSALFELTPNARLVVFRDGRRNGNQLESAERGLLIVEHGEAGFAVSTVTKHLPMAARNGIVYFLGEFEQLPNGNEGNRTLLRFKFLAPS